MDERASRPSSGDPDVPELGTALRAAVARVYSRFRSERAEGEIGDAAVLALAALCKHGPLTLTELSNRARVTPGSMSQTVNRLVAGGYVTREKDPSDGRRVLFVPTRDGRAQADAALAARQDWLNRQLARLDPEERATLARAADLLSRIADS
ncbi:MarR family winged helix-turn-helix transcriptional regulator [Actinoallomurus rhizosphaericola]|uniref:MarR family winged helix-turn-helix transcriptional regulator n=1 Tax=Actinoallomurus rhizosphaericola TaxID=2952536 RepID=UPI0020937B8E|nr:MarR family transcriptional regulator [Actinoallomurus rhizosphaericola]MCO5999441.1 MarR family transcriptional regulator [Actinoallomurus rhizosphaericola]